LHEDFRERLKFLDNFTRSLEGQEPHHVYLKDSNVGQKVLEDGGDVRMRGAHVSRHRLGAICLNIRLASWILPDVPQSRGPRFTVRIFDMTMCCWLYHPDNEDESWQSSCVWLDDAIWVGAALCHQATPVFGLFDSNVPLPAGETYRAFQIGRCSRSWRSFPDPTNRDQLDEVLRADSKVLSPPSRSA
jgi:hypothetical protein